MFNSPYSPFFTSGLLSNGFRRGSLPTDNPKHHHCHQPHCRSFLSLDLAESQSMRTASLNRNTPPSNIRLRVSRDSLRSIPSPKPAPSITLPELPKHTFSPISSTPPRLPSLIPIPALEMPSLSLAISHKPVPPLAAIRPVSVATSSTISTRVRRSNRSEALARLEGRSRYVPLSRRNFMNMSDDDDDDQDHDTDLDSLDSADLFPNPVLEPEDVVLPIFSFPNVPRSVPLLPHHSTSFLVTSPLSVQPHKTKPPFTKDWLPLKSFIDLHNDDDSSSWAWRNFVQISNVS